MSEPSMCESLCVAFFVQKAIAIRPLRGAVSLSSFIEKKLRDRDLDLDLDLT
jgi:hypothetical protein